MKLVNENRRVALYFHLNIQSHPLTVKILSAILPGNYKESMESLDFNLALDNHLLSHTKYIIQILDEVPSFDELNK